VLHPVIARLCRKVAICDIRSTLELIKSNQSQLAALCEQPPDPRGGSSVACRATVNLVVRRCCPGAECSDRIVDAAEEMVCADPVEQAGAGEVLAQVVAGLGQGESDALAVEFVEDVVEGARAGEVDVVHPDDVEHEHPLAAGQVVEGFVDLAAEVGRVGEVPARAIIEWPRRGAVVGDESVPDAVAAVLASRFVGVWGCWGCWVVGAVRGRVVVVRRRRGGRTVVRFGR
jgi:hypothetical protein